MSELHHLADKHGFAECYALPPEAFNHYKRRREDGALHSEGARLCCDPASDFPWANALLLLVYSYSPYAAETGVSGYYPASNGSYHASNAFLAALTARGIRAERIDVPVRELLMRSGLGIPLRNGLTALPPYGTRYVVQTLIAALPEPLLAPEAPRPAHDCGDGGFAQACRACRVCESACPAGAIDETGFHFDRCIRACMGGEAMPAWVMDGMTSLLGCELCQFACPMNAGIEAQSEAPAAFDLERLLAGDTAEAKRLIGKNMDKNRRILQHAAVMAARRGRSDLLPALLALRAHENEAVRVAAEYAISLLSKS